jgi:hypothetical protein
MFDIAIEDDKCLLHLIMGVSPFNFSLDYRSFSLNHESYCLLACHRREGKRRVSLCERCMLSHLMSLHAGFSLPP